MALAILALLETAGPESLVLKAALDSDPATHLNRMMSSAPPDPFDLQGSVPNELGELEFFGGRTTLQNMLSDLERHCPGLGAFGLISCSVSRTIFDTAQLRYHFLFDGMTYHGAYSVEHFSSTASYAF